MRPSRGKPVELVRELRFGSDLSVDQVEALLAAISGFRRGASLSLETRASADGIRHLVRGDQAVVDAFRVQLGGLIPNATLTPVALDPTVPAWVMGTRIGWTRGYPLLRTDAAAQAAAGLLATMTHLGAGEHVRLQVTVSPAPRRELPAQPRAHDRPGGLLAGLLFGPPPTAHELGLIRAKQAGPLLRTTVTVAIASPSQGRAAHLLSGTIGALRIRRGVRSHFDVRLLRGQKLARALEKPARGSVALSPPELAGLVGWPVGAPPLPGLSLGASPRRHPDRRIPTGGRVLALSNWPGSKDRPLAQPLEGALSHTLIAGPTGVGKSALVANLVLSDLADGRGALVLDGKGDLVSDLLERIPAQRLDEVIVLDPATRSAVPGLRVFGRQADPELAADVVLGVLRDLYREHWGIRSEQWLRAGLVTLAHDPHATLGDLRFLFSDDSYRRRLVGRLRDPLLAATWASFEAMSAGEKANQLGAPLTKMNELLGRRAVRAVISQQQPRLDLHEVIARQQLVLAPLAPGALGAPAARLLGALLVHALFTAIQVRQRIPPGKRRPFLVYVDEPRVLADLPVPLDSIFELARGLGVGLTIAAQSLSQLPTAVRQAALTNARTLVCFQQHADDAELLARQLGGGLTSEQLQHLGQYETLLRIGLGPGDTAPPATGRTRPLPPPSSDPVLVRARSAQLYGRDPAEVDRAIASRHNQPDPHDPSGPGASTEDVPVARRRRPT